MARTSKANSAGDVAVAEESVAADVAVAGENIDNAKNEDVAKEVAVEKTASKKTVKVEPLHASTEVAVVSLIPNVRYFDQYTNDYYSWDYVGQVEYLSFETLERMWRNSKGFFRNMWLKPNDDRVIEKFGLKGIYDKYNFLMDEDNYTDDNIEQVYKNLSTASKELKFSICNKIKSMVMPGKITNIHVIKGLESRLQIDLTSFI